MSQAVDIENFASISPSPARGLDQGSTPSEVLDGPKISGGVKSQGYLPPGVDSQAELFRLLFPSSSSSDAEQVTLRSVVSSLTQIHSTLSSLAGSFQELRARVEVLEASPILAPAVLAVPVVAARSEVPVVPGACGCRY